MSDPDEPRSKTDTTCQYGAPANSADGTCDQPKAYFVASFQLCVLETVRQMVRCCDDVAPDGVPKQRIVRFLEHQYVQRYIVYRVITLVLILHIGFVFLKRLREWRHWLAGDHRAERADTKRDIAHHRQRRLSDRVPKYFRHACCCC